MAASGPQQDVGTWGRVSRLLSKVVGLPDGQFTPDRGGTYGEKVVEMVSAKQHKVADEGSYFLTRTNTIGTGIAGVSSVTSYSATNNLLCISNNNGAGGRNIWLDYVYLTATAAATSSTNLFFYSQLDTTMRYASGGYGGAGTNVVTNILNGPYATNSGSNTQSGALVYAGAVVAAAASLQNRILCSRQARFQISVIGDTYMIPFGSTDIPLVGMTGVAQATGGLAVTLPHPPVCIAPGGSFLLGYFGASAGAAPSFEFEIGHVER